MRYYETSTYQGVIGTEGKTNFCLGHVIHGEALDSSVRKQYRASQPLLSNSSALLHAHVHQYMVPSERVDKENLTQNNRRAGERSQGLGISCGFETCQYKSKNICTHSSVVMLLK